MPELIVRVIGDTSSLERSYRKASKDTQRFAVSMKGVGRQVTKSVGLVTAGFFSARGLIDGLETSVEAASNLNEQVSASGVVFGRSASALTSWSRKAATSMGLARDEAMQAAASFGGLAKAAGLTGEEAVTQVEKLIQRGADLASLYNTSVQDALDAIRSGIVGESEPLRRYNVLLSEASTTQEALRETGKRSADQLTQQEKAFARMTLVMRGSSVAAGNFRDTSGGLANQLRIFHANVRNLQIELGETLLPNLTKVVTKFNEWLDNPKNKQRIIDDWTTAIGLLGDAADKAGKFFGTLAEAGDSLGKTLFDAFDWVRGGDFKRAMQVLDAIQRVQANQAARGPTGPRGPVGNPFGLAGPIGTPGLAGPGALTGAPQGTSGSGTAGMTARQLAKLREQAAIRSNTWFDNMIDRLLGRAGDPRSLKGQIGRLNVVVGLLQRRIAITRDITRRLRLQDELQDVLIQIRDKQDQRRQNAIDARKASRQRQQDILAANLADLPELGVAGGPLTVAQVNAAMARRQRAGFDRRMGWLEFAAERAGVTKTNRDDLRVARQMEKAIRDQIATEGRTLELTRRLWETRQKIRDLNKQKADEFTKTRQLSNRQITNILAAGLGLGAGGRSRLLFNVAKSDVALNVGVEIDGREVGRAVRKDTSRTGYRTSRQTSGFRG